MSNAPINVIHVFSMTAGWGTEAKTVVDWSSEIQTLVKKNKLNIEVKEIPLLKYGTPIFDRSKLRELTSAALEDHPVSEIEYVVAHCPIIVEILSRPDNQVKWAQCPSAGVDMFFKDLDQLKIKDGFVMTRTTGRDRGLMLAEYVIGHILARERNIVGAAELQKQKKYDRHALNSYRMMGDLTVGILGLGSIGSEIARVCKAMGMTVWAALRDQRFNSQNPGLDNVDHARPMSKLSEMLEACDYVACVLPSTPETTGLLNGDVLEPCKAKKTVLINGGRGNLIDDQSLIKAVNQGWLGGAILDVLNQEPLPNDSPLWSLPGVTITPHVSCLSQNSSSMVARLYVDNLLRYIKGEQLNNQVDFSKGY